MQLEAYTSNPSFWVNLGILAVIFFLIKKLSPMISAGLDKRSKEISEELERAQALREEAQVVLAQYQKKQRESLEEAEAIIQQANIEARRITKEAEAEVEESLQKRMKLAVSKIEQAERHAMAEVQSHLVDITVNATRQIITDKLDAKTRDEMVKNASDDILEKLH